MNPVPVKRKARESHQAYEREPKFQFPISEFHIRVSGSTHSEVWRYFGDLFHNVNHEVIEVQGSLFVSFHLFTTGKNRL